MMIIYQNLKLSFNKEQLSNKIFYIVYLYKVDKYKRNNYLLLFKDCNDGGNNGRQK